MKIIASASILSPKLGLISFDYERIDYSTMNLSSNGNAITSVNDDIKTIYRDANNFKLGAELRLNSLMIRGGAGYYSSPSTEPELKDLYSTSFSCGLGYRGPNFYIDFGFMQTRYSDKYLLYNFVERDVPSNNTYEYVYQPQIADLRYKLNKFMVTVGYHF